MTYSFEIWDEQTQRIEFYFDHFEQYRQELFRQYPVTAGHTRAEISLYFPSDRLEDVFVHDWNPHHELGNTHLSVYDCFYSSSDWSTIFEVYSMHDRNHPEAVRCFIEEDHRDPWGEPVRVMSTSANIHDNRSHRFAYFRGKYWKIIGWKVHRFVPTRDWYDWYFDWTHTINNIWIEHVQTIERWAACFGHEHEVGNWIEEGF